MRRGAISRGILKFSVYFKKSVCCNLLALLGPKHIQHQWSSQQPWMQHKPLVTPPGPLVTPVEHSRELQAKCYRTGVCSEGQGEERMGLHIAVFTRTTSLYVQGVALLNHHNVVSPQTSQLSQLTKVCLVLTNGVRSNSNLL